MKKGIFLTLFAFFTFLQIQSQVTFKPGIKGGLNFSHFTQTDNPDERFSSKKDYYVGVFGALKATKMYTLQPEITYTRQGSEYEYIVNGFRRNETLNVSYLSLAVANKFTFNIINFQLGTTFDIKVNDTKKILGDTNYNDNSYNGVDFGFFAGIGCDFTKNFGIEARIKKGIIPVNSGWDYSNVVVQLGAAYTFDLK